MTETICVPLGNLLERAQSLKVLEVKAQNINYSADDIWALHQCLRNRKIRKEATEAEQKIDRVDIGVLDLAKFANGARPSSGVSSQAKSRRAAGRPSGAAS